MLKIAPCFVGLALTLAPAALRADDHSKEKTNTKVESDGDVKTRSKSKDHISGEKTKTKTTVESDGDEKYESKSKVHGRKEKVKGKVDVDGDEVKVKEKRKIE